MTRKFLFSGLRLVGAGYGAGKSAAWYLNRRLQRV
jgi:hypothetical protein